MAAHQASPSLGFSRQEHWSGLPFPSPMHECEVAQSCPTVHNPVDCTLPGSALHGIFQARVLEWVAIAFSDLSFLATFKRQWQPTPVFLLGESQGWRSLVGCRLWGRTELDTTEATQQQLLNRDKECKTNANKYERGN